eukprot:c51333_g1_i1 orf=50-307(+)
MDKRRKSMDSVELDQVLLDNWFEEEGIGMLWDILLHFDTKYNIYLWGVYAIDWINRNYHYFQIKGPQRWGFVAGKVVKNQSVMVG